MEALRRRLEGEAEGSGTGAEGVEGAESASGNTGGARRRTLGRLFGEQFWMRER
jgi:hypothetical protein